MAKLGYTWYPKDWGSSESVFELNLSERGLYREFIDLAMINNNVTKINLDVWIRKFCVSIEELNVILDKLKDLKLIEIKGDILIVPSCESRLNLVRGGSKGGKKSKPTTKPIPKPDAKPTSKQREIEREIETKEKVKENKYPTESEFLNYALSNNPNLDKQAVVNKFKSWSESDWYNGNGAKIKNWKSSLLNTIPYLPVVKTEIKRVVSKAKDLG